MSMSSTTADNELQKRLEYIESLRKICDPSIYTPNESRPKAKIITPRPAKTLPDDVPLAALRWTEEQIRPTVKETLGRKIVRIEYDEVPAELNDKVFEARFEELFKNISNFADYHFAYHDLEADGKQHHLWPLMSKEFVEYASMVAEADPRNGGWNALLLNSTQRKWLVAGLLMRIFRRYIFDELLFGATDQEQQLLQSFEDAFLEADGFVRQPLRSRTVRTILRRDPMTEDTRRDPATQNFSPVTDNFYIDVAMLTDQIYKLLLPLTRYLYAKNVPRELRQQLHNIVSDAAYLSIMIRCHEDIVLMIEVQPGEHYDDEEHTSLAHGMYHDFKAKVVDFYTKKAQRHKESAEKLMAEARNAGKENYQAPTVPPNDLHRALCKIAVWPRVKSYKRGSGKPGGVDDGLRQYYITYGAGVWYFGVENRTKPRESIHSYINSLREAQQDMRPFWQRLRDKLPFSGSKTSSRGRKPIGVTKTTRKITRHERRRGQAGTNDTSHQLRKVSRDMKYQSNQSWCLGAISIFVCISAAYAILPSLLSNDYSAAYVNPYFIRNSAYPRMDRAMERMARAAREKGIGSHSRL